MVRTLARPVALGVVASLPACVASVDPRTPSELVRDEVEAVESGEQYEAPAHQATAAQGTALARVLGLRARLDPSDRKEADDWIAGHLTMFALPQLDRFALGSQGLQYGTTAAPEVRAAFAVYCARSPGMADRLVAWLASRHDPPLVRSFFDAMLARDPEGLCAHPRWSTDRPSGSWLACGRRAPGGPRCGPPGQQRRGDLREPALHRQLHGDGEGPAADVRRELLRRHPPHTDAPSAPAQVGGGAHPQPVERARSLRPRRSLTTPRRPRSTPSPCTWPPSWPTRRSR